MNDKSAFNDLSLFDETNCWFQDAESFFRELLRFAYVLQEVEVEEENQGKWVFAHASLHIRAHSLTVELFIFECNLNVRPEIKWIIFHLK